MNVVYRVEWTEYEHGCGNRPDGITYSTDEQLLINEINRRTWAYTSDYKCYTVASAITLCIISEELFAKLCRNKGMYSTMDSDDPGMLGAFVSKNPKLNIATFRSAASSIAAQ